MPTPLNQPRIGHISQGLENAEASTFHEDINQAAPTCNYIRAWGGAGGNGGGDQLERDSSLPFGSLRAEGVNPGVRRTYSGIRKNHMQLRANSTFSTSAVGIHVSRR